MPDHDPYHLSRFVSAQEKVYENVLSELRSGLKITHWMWFIFPQMEGLGYSSISRHFSIKSGEEARQYLNHPVLGPRLYECAQAVLAIPGKTAWEVFGSPDDLKLKSSMTLFARYAGPDSVFARVLDRYFDGEQDRNTLLLLGKPDS